jgi:hypothetical protein
MGGFYHTTRTRTIGLKVRVTISTGVMRGRERGSDPRDNLMNAKQIPTYSDLAFHR